MQTIQHRAQAPSQTKPQTQKSSRYTAWLVRIFIGLAVILVAVVAGGLAYQAIGEANDARTYPPPGQMVNVNGLNLHLYCTGEGSPTVILEAMAGNNSTEWGWIQPEIAKGTRVCSYDRAGAGWSVSAAAGRSAQETVQDLHNLLQNANIQPPYVLVGHSIGGIYTRMYAAQYPDEVAGMVLMDAAHPDQVKRYPAFRTAMESYSQEAGVYIFLARLGLFRLYFDLGGAFDFAELTPQERGALKAMWSAPKYHEGGLRDMPAAMALFDNPPTPGTLGSRPLIVVSATENQPEGWKELQSDLATLSSNATHRIAQGTAHASLAFNPEHAQTVTRAIQEVLAAVRATPQ